MGNKGLPGTIGQLTNTCSPSTRSSSPDRSLPNTSGATAVQVPQKAGESTCCDLQNSGVEECIRQHVLTSYFLNVVPLIRAAMVLCASNCGAVRFWQHGTCLYS